MSYQQARDAREARGMSQEELVVASDYAVTLDELRRFEDGELQVWGMRVFYCMQLTTGSNPCQSRREMKGNKSHRIYYDGFFLCFISSTIQA